MIGKEKRLNRLLNNDSKNIIITPLDHGLTIGPVDGIDKIGSLIPLLIKNGSDSLILHKGLIRHYYTHLTASKLGLIMHLSASTTFCKTKDYKVIIGSVEEALDFGCDGVSVHINFGDEHELEMISDVSKISSQCSKAGMPLLIMVYIKNNVNNLESINHTVRVAFELGADLIKTTYTGDISSFKHIVDGCPVPILVAGGEKIDNDTELINMVDNAMLAGARGIAIGRNVFQNRNIENIMQKLGQTVHIKYNNN